MDIREWLQHTADREPPDERVETGFPAFLQPQPEEHRRKSRQERKHMSSNSSSPARRPSVQSSSSEPPRRLRKDADATSSRSSSSSSSQSRQSTESDRRQVPVETFERRARHKTKPDRYESKPKRRKKEHKSRRDRKHDTKRRKSRRHGDGARTAGLVQNFQLKTGSKNQRLTLKPDASAGIFKNGRASGPVTTSGPGLPDLVFNEMKFLRRPKEHQDEQPAGDLNKKKSKKVSKEAREAEISAYFNKNLPPDKQNGLAAPDVVPPVSAKSGAQQQPTDRRHSAELPEKAFLGFGSRGPPQDGVESQKASNSYYTWSESLPAKDSPPLRRPVVPAFDAPHDRSRRRGQHAIQRVETASRRRKSEQARSHHIQSPAVAGQWVESQRARGPVVIEVYQPPKPVRRSTPALVEDSEPLPGAAQNFDNTRLEESGRHWEEGDYRTSDILQIRGTVEEAGHPQPHLGRDQSSKPLLNEENEDPATSSPTSERLRHAFGAVTRSETEAVKVFQGPSLKDGEERGQPRFKLSYGRRFSPHENGCAIVTSSPTRWEMPQRGFSRASDAQDAQQRPSSRLATAARPQSRLGTSIRPQIWAQVQPHLMRATESRNGSYKVFEEEMLDVLPGTTLLRPQRPFVAANVHEGEAVMRRLGSSIGYENGHQTNADMVRPAVDRYAYPEAVRRTEEEEDFEAFSFAPDPRSFQDQQMIEQISGKQFQSEYFSVDDLQDEEEVDNSHREEANPVLAGFWRPNMLY